MDTGSSCPLATVFVPGTSLDATANVAGAVVPSTSDREDRAELAIPVGAIDGDRAQELLLDLPARGDHPATRLSLHTRGRSLAPLDARGTDFGAAPAISQDALNEAVAALDPSTDLDGLDSLRAGLTTAAEPLIVVIDDRGNQSVLGLCHGGNTALASCGWSRGEASAYQRPSRRRAKHLRTWQSIL